MTETNRNRGPELLATLIDATIREAWRRRIERARELSERSAATREEREPVGAEMDLAGIEPATPCLQGRCSPD